MNVKIIKEQLKDLMQINIFQSISALVVGIGLAMLFNSNITSLGKILSSVIMFVSVLCYYLFIKMYTKRLLTIKKHLSSRNNEENEKEN